MISRRRVFPQRYPFAAIAGMALLLGACAESGGLLAGLGLGQDQAAGAAVKVEENQQASLTPPTPSPAPPPIVTPGELIGRESAEVAKLLGKPTFARRDGGAEIWQYRGKACILDVFLYKGQFGRLVEHAELRRRDEGEISDRDCLADVLTGAKGGDAG